MEHYIFYYITVCSWFFHLLYTICIVSYDANVKKNVIFHWMGFCRRNYCCMKTISQRDLLVYLIVFLFKLCIGFYLTTICVYRWTYLNPFCTGVCIKKINHVFDARFIWISMFIREKITGFKTGIWYDCWLSSYIYILC